ncbi:hypothetical protein [Brachybacterium vulturis]|uniref:hypothetical protein n=1 Tax=Brachybacterium vulturis TaxID=2017484 RepID=UPI00373668CC
MTTTHQSPQSEERVDRADVRGLIETTRGWACDCYSDRGYTRLAVYFSQLRIVACDITFRRRHDRVGGP